MGLIDKAASDIPDFSEAVISIWFKLPAAAIAAAVAQYEAIPVTSGSLEDGNLPGVIPLFTFGIPSAITGAVPDSTNRCVIGVACGHRDLEDIADEVAIQPPRMFVHLQYDSGSVNRDFGIDAFDYFQIGGAVVLGYAARGLYKLPGQFIEVTADQWHHILVSFDLSGGCEASFQLENGIVNFDTPCQFWWAFDDANYDSEYLWPSNPCNFSEEEEGSPVSGGANDIYSTGCMLPTEENTPVTLSGPLPVAGNPMGIPGVTADVPKNYNIYMTEVQVYTDVSMDTSVEFNRRLFVSDSGRPVPPDAAISFFGKEPEIYFKTHTDAINGTNRGTADDFTPTGTVLQYTPGP